jgi:hypothetical protein
VVDESIFKYLTRARIEWSQCVQAVEENFTDPKTKKLKVVVRHRQHSAAPLLRAHWTSFRRWFNRVSLWLVKAVRDCIRRCTRRYRNRSKTTYDSMQRGRTIEEECCVDGDCGSVEL